MYQIVYVITSTVRFIVIALEVMMLARAVVSWLPVDEDHPIINFLYTVTEPVIMPVYLVVELVLLLVLPDLAVTERVM